MPIGYFYRYFYDSNTILTRISIKDSNIRTEVFAPEWDIKLETDRKVAKFYLKRY